MSQLRVSRLAVEVLGHSIRRLGRAILILFVFVVKTTIEVGRSFVLIWSTMLCPGLVNVNIRAARRRR